MEEVTQQGTFDFETRAPELDSLENLRLGSTIAEMFRSCYKLLEMESEFFFKLQQDKDPGQELIALARRLDDERARLAIWAAEINGLSELDNIEEEQRLLSQVKLLLTEIFGRSSKIRSLFQQHIKVPGDNPDLHLHSPSIHDAITATSDITSYISELFSLVKEIVNLKDLRVKKHKDQDASESSVNATDYPKIMALPSFKLYKRSFIQSTIGEDSTRETRALEAQEEAARNAAEVRRFKKDFKPDYSEREDATRASQILAGTVKATPVVPEGRVAQDRQSMGKGTGKLLEQLRSLMRQSNTSMSKERTSTLSGLTSPEPL